MVVLAVMLTFFNVVARTEIHKLTASDGAESDQFGTSVAIDELCYCGHILMMIMVVIVLVLTSSTSKPGPNFYKLTASDGASG